jgi:hypothetical protein
MGFQCIDQRLQNERVRGRRKRDSPHNPVLLFQSCQRSFFGAMTPVDDIGSQSPNEDLSVSVNIEIVMQV